MRVAVNNGFSRRDLLIFYYKYRRRLWLAFAIPLLLSVVIAFIPTARYQAQSMLIVRLGSEYVYQPEVGTTNTGPNAAIPFTQEQTFKSEVGILNSDDLHAQVIASVGMEKLFPDLVHPTGIKWILRKAHNLGTQTLVLLHIIDAPTQEQLQHHVLASAVELFDKRFDILLEKESAVIDVSYEHPEYPVALETLDTLLKLYFEKRKNLYSAPRAKTVEAQMIRMQAQSVAAAQAVEHYKRQHQLYSLENQRSELLARRAQAQEQSLAISDGFLNQKLGRYNAALDRLDTQERELQVLERDAKIAADAYGLYAHKLDEARAYEDMERDRADSVRIIQAPVVGPEPKSLVTWILLGGLFLSIMSLFSVAALTEYFRTGFTTPAQLEQKLQLPVLAVFPYREQMAESTG